MFNRILKVVILLLSGGVIGFYLVTKLDRVQRIQETTLHSDRAKPKASLNSNQFKELLQADRAPAPRTESAGDECAESFAPLMAIEWTEGFKIESLPKKYGPCPGETEMMQKQRSMYEELCSEKALKAKDSDKKKQAADLCLSAFFLARAHANGWMHRSDDISKIDDLKLLVDILLASGGNMDVGRFEESAARLRELAPGMYEPLKASIVAKVMRASMLEEGAHERQFSEIMSMLERDIEEARGIPNSDPELQEAIILARTRMGQDKDKMPEVLNDLRKWGYSGPTIAYYEAAVLWKLGERAEAIRRIRELANQHKNDERFSETLKKLEADPEGKEKNFTSRLSVNFDLLGK